MSQVNDPETGIHSETLEKLFIGLQLLKEVKASKNIIHVPALTYNSTLQNCTHVLQQLAEQATVSDNYELQDACLLLEDSLSELSETEFTLTKTDLIDTLNTWITQTAQPKTNLFSIYISNIEQLANQANLTGYSGLHDVSLILIDALQSLSEQQLNITQSDLSALLENWANLVQAYQQNSSAALDDIMMILRHPDLNLPFTEDDFSTFELLLAEDLTSHSIIEPPVKSVAPAVEVSPIDNDRKTIPISDSPAFAQLSPEAQELVELLDTEVGILNYRFLDIHCTEPDTLKQKHLEQASEELSRLINAAKMVGFEGLSLVCEQVNANLALFMQNIESFNEEKRTLLLNWIFEVKNYLLVFNQPDAGKSLVEYICHPTWLVPFPEQAVGILLPQMQVKGFGEQDNNPTESYREKIATDEDVSLELPNDVNKELLDLLLQELPNYTQQFSEALQHLQSGEGTSKDIDVAQRVAHTIKGSANTVGIKGIAVLTHQMEDILMACAKAHIQPTGTLLDSLINASDCLEAMCEHLLGQGDAPPDTKNTLQDILDWANQIDKKGVQNVIKEQQNAPNRKTTPKKIEPEHDVTKDKAEKNETATTMVRVPTEQIENLFRLSGESIILNGQIFERQRRLKNQLQNMDAQFELLQQLGAGLEQLIDLKDLSGRRSISIDRDFDALEMDQYNELHTASRRMVEASVDAREISIDMKKELEYMSEILEYQQRLVIDTQEAIMQTRFVPVGSIALRLQRGVRQTCRLTGKQAELTLMGENLLIDGDTLNALVEPLMHLLRNAIDHGLESEQQRIALGKNPIGHVKIEFDREGNSIVIRCHDDGQGLDFDSIRRTAEQRGDIKTSDNISEEDLKRFILRPNFSTRSESTQTSGRGVGMDVVNFQVSSLGGNLILQSVRGEGLTVELRVPLPLSRSHALLAYAGSYKVAISSKGLTQILYSEIGELKTISNEQVLVLDENIYPVVKLEDLLHIEDRRKNRRHGAVLLVQHDNKTTAVLVSAITDSREVVIKNIGYYMKKIHGFVGATILGDGSVTPVLDIPELLRAPVQARTNSQIARADVIDPSSRLPLVLVVDDSLSQRRALEQILTDAGFRVYIARDGIEAAEWLANAKPAVVITDLEMPRMNGIELISHIRSQAKIKHLPIIMITSRTTQKHKQMAEEAGVDYYLFKPVQDEDLLIKIQSLINKQQDMVAA